MTTALDRKTVSVSTLAHKKLRGEPITMLTAYDYPTARALERAGVDAILVGDSLAMVVLGHENTLAVTMDEMVHHAKAVARGATMPLLVADMPFLSYQVSRREAVRNAGRFLKEAGMNAVKLEGGREQAGTIRAIVAAGIPVMGHLGMTPQRLHQVGGYRVQARTHEAALRLVDDAQILQHAGCFAIVLELVPDRVAELIAKRLRIPVIGIGAGRGCDGQVLVSHDLLGIYDRFTPRFVRRYGSLGQDMFEAFLAFNADVEARRFPGPEHSVEIDDAEWEALRHDLERTPAAAVES